MASVDFDLHPAAYKVDAEQCQVPLEQCLLGRALLAMPLGALVCDRDLLAPELE